MPVMDGIQATTEIRRREAARGTRTPIIALTAHALTSDRDRCKAAGMDLYLSKPMRFEAIAAALEEVTAGATPKSDVPHALDEASLVSSLGGDVELAVQLSEMFFDESENMLSSVRSSWAKRDAEAMQASVHNLKGSISNFDTGPAWETAKRIEGVIRRGDMAAVSEDDVARLESETRSVVKALRGFVARTHGAVGSEGAQR